MQGHHYSRFQPFYQESDWYCHKKACRVDNWSPRIIDRDQNMMSSSARWLEQRSIPLIYRHSNSIITQVPNSRCRRLAMVASWQSRAQATIVQHGQPTTGYQDTKTANFQALRTCTKLQCNIAVAIVEASWRYPNSTWKQGRQSKLSSCGCATAILILEWVGAYQC